MHFHIANPDDIGQWLSGYYSGKSGNLLLDRERMKARLKTRGQRVEGELLEESQSAPAGVLKGVLEGNK